MEAHASVVGLDIAKSVFQVHTADAAGRPVIRRKLDKAAGVIKTKAWVGALPVHSFPEMMALSFSDRLKAIVDRGYDRLFPQLQLALLQA